MGIYIPIEMPKTGECIVVYGDGEVWHDGKRVVKVGSALEVPPHGRLLDEKQILRLIDEQRQNKYNRTHRPKMMWSDVVNAFEWLLQWADTIIPSEEE